MLHRINMHIDCRFVWYIPIFNVFLASLGESYERWRPFLYIILWQWNYVIMMVIIFGPKDFTIAYVYRPLGVTITDNVYSNSYVLNHAPSASTTLSAIHIYCHTEDLRMCTPHYSSNPRLSFLIRVILIVFYAVTFISCPAFAIWCLLAFWTLKLR